MGSSVYSKIPFKPVSAANLKALLMASTLVFSFKITLISISEPFGTGTRTPHPPILPSKSGKIAVIALAAPVVVGIMDTAAARALRKSLCGESCKFWSLV
jgi:uncharacterized PurR-regulated membrane protein YhhQ (DUF165 family)